MVIKRRTRALIYMVSSTRVAEGVGTSDDDGLHMFGLSQKLIRQIVIQYGCRSDHGHNSAAFHPTVGEGGSRLVALRKGECEGVQILQKAVSELRHLQKPASLHEGLVSLQPSNDSSIHCRHNSQYHHHNERSARRCRYDHFKILLVAAVAVRICLLVCHTTVLAP